MFLNFPHGVEFSSMVWTMVKSREMRKYMFANFGAHIVLNVKLQSAAACRVHTKLES